MGIRACVASVVTGLPSFDVAQDRVGSLRAAKSDRLLATTHGETRKQMRRRRMSAIGVLGALCLAAACVLGLPLAAAQPPIQLPGAPAFDAALQQRLRQAWKVSAKASTPRPTHVNLDGSPRYINRLVFSSSPYLQQHAYNPVNWYPWGEEAFAAARREHKPIFLSIGYSTCHWCHVMERECFENEAIARLLNEQLHRHQGRSRGAARHRRRVHGCGPAHDRERRLAAERVPHARAPTVLRRHLLPAGGSRRPARVFRDC